MSQTAPETAAAEPRRIGPERHGSERLRHGIARGSAMELAGYRSIWRWMSRQPYVPEGASGFSYDKPIRTILLVFIVLSAVEIPLIDLLVHGIPWLRWPFIALGVWGVVTMLGILLGNITRPHSVGPDGIRFRNGGEIDVDLPWEVIASVERRRHALADASGLRLTGFGDEQVLNHVIQDHSDIEIVLERPTLIALPQGEVTVAALRISVDDPAGFLDAVRTHIP
jgi:hypothetical protein